MRNINELIGLINGIDYDGEINEKEVERLQKWVDLNRNLAYEQKQIEFIDLLDSVLEDHVITEEERTILIAFCSKHLNNAGINPEIYLLQGIIDGITSDGIINELEVQKLKGWMGRNRSQLLALNYCDDLIKTIDRLLANGEITETEQNKEFENLSLEINKIYLEAKIAYLKKQVRLKHNIGLDLIDLVGDEEAIDEIHKRAVKELKKVLTSKAWLDYYNPEIVFISLVLIAMLRYEEGRYYESVRDTYDELYDIFSAPKIEGFIRSLLAKYSKNEENKGRNINIALNNAIVPGYYLPAFFDFIYDIYKLNFECDLSDDIYGDFAFVYDGLRQMMLSEGDDVQVNATRKTYKLIKTTKQLIAQEDSVDSVIKLSIIIVRLIDKRIWNKEIKVFNPYLKQGFGAWSKSIEPSAHGRGRRRSKAELRSRWEPKYLLQNNMIYVVPPIHRIKATYDYRTIRAVVENKGETLFEEKCPDIREIIGGYEVNLPKIMINAPLGDLTYKLMSDDLELYNSKDKLYREVLVFTQEGSEIKNNTDFHGTSVFCHKDKNDKLKPYYEGENYCLSVYGAHVGDAILIGDTVFNFSSLVRPGLFGEELIGYYLYNENSKEKHKMYSSVKYLVFESTAVQADHEINIDGIGKKIADFEIKISKREGVNKYAIHLPSLTPGLHHIDIFELKNGRKSLVTSFKFGIDPTVQYDVEELEQGKYIASIESALLSDIIKEEINNKNYNKYGFVVDINGMPYRYIIPLPIMFYSLDAEGDIWNDADTPIWIGDITSETVIHISDPSISEIQVYGANGKPIEERIHLNDKAFVKEARIGFLTTYKESHLYFLLTLIRDGKKTKTLICYNKCILSDDTEIEYDTKEKCLNVCPVYHGKGNVYFNIMDNAGEVIYKSTILESGEMESVENLRSFMPYRIVFFEKKRGLSLQGDREIDRYERTIYDWDDMVGKSFKLREIYYDHAVKGKFIRINQNLKNSRLSITKKIEEDVFEGEVYAIKDGKRYDLDKINPVTVEICGEVIDGTVELSITKDGDGLLLDFTHHGIMNTMYNRAAIDIFSFILELKGTEFV